MGLFSEYIDQNLNFQELTQERKRQLARISQLRSRDVLVMAADLGNSDPRTSICYSDLQRVNDQLANLNGDALDLVLETPGGSGEVVEDIVRLLRGKYPTIGVIVPGWAKSAGTIMAMAGDEILMEPASALGPIDAQLMWQGKVFSAEALIQGVDKIKDEVLQTGVLNKAYIPILQGISPGELQHALNALEFGKRLVTSWLAQYKFRTWTTHSTTGRPVTQDERQQRAKEIADALCDHSRWLSHGRSIKIGDLEDMGLRVTDYLQIPDLADAISRYHTLLRMTFSSNAYKVFETPTSQLVDFLAQPVPLQTLPQNAENVIAEVLCSKCQSKMRVQVDFGKQHPLQKGCLRFPADNKLKCAGCGTEHDLTSMRRQLEAQANKPVAV